LPPAAQPVVGLTLEGLAKLTAGSASSVAFMARETRDGLCVVNTVKPVMSAARAPA
jgi:hypothetical protein